MGQPTTVNSAQLPHCRVVEVFKAVSLRWLKVGLSIVFAAAVGIGLFQWLLRGSLVPALSGLAVVGGFLAGPLAVALLLLVLFDQLRRRRLRKTMDREDAMPDRPAFTAEQQLDREIVRLALEHPREVPWRFTRADRAELPDAIILWSLGGPDWVGHRVTPPTSSSIPFEPIPLGRDPNRTAELLENLVGFRVRTTHPEFSAFLLGHTSFLHNTFSFSRAMLVGLFIVLLGALFMRDIGMANFLYPAGGILAAAIVFQVATRVLAARRENAPPTCWLFPGIIGVPGGGRRAGGAKRDLIARRGDGILWYDAAEGKLFVPAGAGAYTIVRCGLPDGVLAIWAWLNTGPAPDVVQLEEIA